MAKYAYQIVSRNNDVNGNPYRLGLVYDMNTGMVVRAIEARSSSPNFRHELYKQGHVELGGFHLSPSEYNETKRQVKKILEHSH